MCVPPLHIWYCVTKGYHSVPDEFVKHIYLAVREVTGFYLTYFACSLPPSFSKRQKIPALAPTNIFMV